MFEIVVFGTLPTPLSSLFISANKCDVEGGLQKLSQSGLSLYS
jgi:hypothetical protein